MTCRKEHRRNQIDSLAAEVLQANAMVSAPINVEAIACAEEIVLLPGTYDNCFDGRIEFRQGPHGRQFFLFYAEANPGSRPPGRVRFSIAHELGHYFIPEHREFLLSGTWHGSQADYLSDKPTEREADQFASSLLMPEAVFNREVASASGRVLTLRELSSLASYRFQTSLTSTVIRYVQLCFEACAVVISREGRVLYSISSEDMQHLGMSWLRRGLPVPPQSPTGQVHRGAEERKQGEIDSDAWYGRSASRCLWEDSIRLGGTGVVITLLAAQET